MINEDFQTEEANSEFAQMLKEQEASKGKSDGIIKAVIMKIDSDYVYLDTNQKTERRMPVGEICDEKGNHLFNINDEIEVAIENNRTSYKSFLAKKKLKAFIDELEGTENKVINTKVVAKNKGGYVVEYDGMNLFMPRSLSMLKSADDQIGRMIDVVILKYSHDDGILVSRKHFLDTKNEAVAKKAQELMQASENIKCKIVKIINFGIFVDIDGVAGVIRYNEISHKGNVNPSETYKIGDEIEAKIVKFDEKRQIIELSIKALLPDPWDKIDTLVQVNDKVKGKVVNIQPYGAFVNLEGKDLDALLHISEISWDRGIKNPTDKLTLAQELELVIINIDKENKQIKCSLKQLEQKPYDKFIEKYEVGDIVTGKVVYISDFGAFINVNFLDCLLLNVNCSWNKGDTCKSVFKKGEDVEVIIDSFDKDREKVYVNRKKLLKSPVDTFVSSYKVGDRAKGKIVAIKDFGIFANVDDLLDVFIPTKDVEPLKVSEVKIDDEIEFTIREINTKNYKVRASVKNEDYIDESAPEMKNFIDDGKITLGDVIRRK